MQFHSIDATVAEGEESQEQPGGTAGRSGEVAKNLLKHIPGEASGFYLIGAGAFENPGPMTLGALFAMALGLLLLIRFLAKASRGITVSTVIAFLLWMFIIDNGFLATLFPVLPDPWGLILAGFYSTVITILASAGKIK